jgi:hypothetical protein
MPKKISVEGDLSSAGGAPFDTGLSATVFAGGKKVALKDQTTSSISDDLYLSYGGNSGGSGGESGSNEGNSEGGGYGAAGAQMASQGSPNVFAEGKAVHRIDDARLSGATTVGPGITTVIVN